MAYTNIYSNLFQERPRQLSVILTEVSYMAAHRRNKRCFKHILTATNNKIPTLVKCRCLPFILWWKTSASEKQPRRKLTLMVKVGNRCVHKDYSVSTAWWQIWSDQTHIPSLTKQDGETSELTRKFISKSDRQFSAVVSSTLLKVNTRRDPAVVLVSVI